MSASQEIAKVRSTRFVINITHIPILVFRLPIEFNKSLQSVKMRNFSSSCFKAQWRHTSMLHHLIRPLSRPRLRKIFRPCDNNTGRQLNLSQPHSKIWLHLPTLCKAFQTSRKPWPNCSNWELLRTLLTFTTSLGKSMAAKVKKRRNWRIYWSKCITASLLILTLSSQVSSTLFVFEVNDFNITFTVATADSMI